MAIGRTNGQMGGGAGSALSFDNYISYIITTADGGGAFTSLNINQTWNLQNPRKRIGILVNRTYSCEANLNASISFSAAQVDTPVPFARVPGTPSAWFGIIKPKKDITSIAGSISGDTSGFGIHITMFEIPEFFVGSIMMGARLTSSGQSRTFDLEGTGLKSPFYFYSATIQPSINVSEIHTKCYLMPKYGDPIGLGQGNGFFIGASDVNPTITYTYQTVNNIDPFIIY